MPTAHHREPCPHHRRRLSIAGDRRSPHQSRYALLARRWHFQPVPWRPTPAARQLRQRQSDWRRDLEVTGFSTLISFCVLYLVLCTLYFVLLFSVVRTFRRGA